MFKKIIATGLLTLSFAAPLLSMQLPAQSRVANFIQKNPITNLVAKKISENPNASITIAAVIATQAVSHALPKNPQAQAAVSLSAAATAGALLGYFQKTWSEALVDRILKFTNANVSTSIPATCTTDGMKFVKTVAASALGLAIKYGVVYPLYNSFNVTTDIKGKPAKETPQHTVFDITNNIAGAITPLKLAWKSLSKINASNLWQGAVSAHTPKL